MAAQANGETYAECKQVDGGIDDYFATGGQLGAGGYGTVFLATTTALGRRVIGDDLPAQVAIKRMSVKYPRQAGAQENPKAQVMHHSMLSAELRVLKELKLRHSLKYYGCLHIGEYIYVITNVAPGVELFNLIVDGVDVSDKLLILLALAEAIDEFHKAGYAHQDIKPENIFVDKRVDMHNRPYYHATLLDYGFICNKLGLNNYGCRHKCGTKVYADPAQRLLDYKSMMLGDWWSFAQVAYALYMGANLNQLVLADEDDPESEFVDINVANMHELVGAEAPLEVAELLEQLTGYQDDQARRPSPEHIIRTIKTAVRDFYAKADARGRAIRAGAREHQRADQSSGVTVKRKYQDAEHERGVPVTSRVPDIAGLQWLNPEDVF